MRPLAAFIVLGLLLTLMAGSRDAVGGPAAGGEPPVRGGVLRVAHSGEPPTLDLHWTTGAPTQDIAIHLYEGLFALSSRYQAKPMLVERWSVTPDRRTYTFILRRGVLFHHGREMTADDVVASLQRWGQIAARGRELFRDVEALTIRDASTVQMRLREPNGLVPLALAIPSQGAVIYPREVIEEAGSGLIRRFIDPEATLLWLDKRAPCPPTAVGFGFDGATFCNSKTRVTYEELLAGFRLDKNAGLAKIGRLVHALDAGNRKMPEAAGVETLLAGARHRAANEDELLRESERTFDLLYEAYFELPGKKVNGEQ